MTAPPRREQPAPIIAREGWPIVAGFVIGWLVLSNATWYLAGPVGGWTVWGVGLLLVAWCVWFFRDPARRLPADPEAVICPADGRVVIVDEAPPPAELELGPAPMRRVCIFMNVFNVHVNRCPTEGRVEKIAYRPGAFFNASFDKASDLNERSSMLVRLPDGRAMVVVQIAGLVARRIVCRVKEGAVLSGGERYGLIRFGSRVDVYLPEGAKPAVRVGDVTAAGETIIAHLGFVKEGEACS